MKVFTLQNALLSTVKSCEEQIFLKYKFHSRKINVFLLEKTNIAVTTSTLPKVSGSLVQLGKIHVICFSQLKEQSTERQSLK